jgi:hypothetical protein
LRRLLKPDKGRPFLRACQRLPVEVAPQVGMSVRGAAVFLRVGYVAGHRMAYIRLQTRSGDVSVGSKAELHDHDPALSIAAIPGNDENCRLRNSGCDRGHWSSSRTPKR